MPVAWRGYDVSLDGQRFLLIKDGTTDDKAPLPSMIVVLNWREELTAKLPVKSRSSNDDHRRAAAHH